MAGESAREVARRARAKAERLQKYADSYERGADGESLTAETLAMLPPGWRVLHDVRWPGRRFANIDHIVIGPAGVFVVDSKNWSGRITITDDQLRQNGRSRESAVAGCADSALALGERIAYLGSHVFPVLCFVGEHELSGWCRDVMVCSRSNLVEMLLSRPVVLSPAEVLDTWSRLDVLLRVAAPEVRPAESTSRPRRGGAPQPRRPSSARQAAQRPPRRPQRRRTKKRGSLARPIIGLLMLLGMLSIGPQLATAFSGFVSGQLTDPATRDCSAKNVKQSNGGADQPAGSAAGKARPPSSC